MNFVQKQFFAANNIFSRFGTYCQLLFSQQTDSSGYIRYAVALELQPIGGLAKLCFDFVKW